MSDIRREIIYSRILTFYLAQSRLFASLTLTYKSRTSFDFSLSYLVY
jgi:hypothetical protein